MRRAGGVGYPQSLTGLTFPGAFAFWPEVAINDVGQRCDFV